MVKSIKDLRIYGEYRYFVLRHIHRVIIAYLEKEGGIDEPTMIPVSKIYSKVILELPYEKFLSYLEDMKGIEYINEWYKDNSCIVVEGKKIKNFDWESLNNV